MPVVVRTSTQYKRVNNFFDILKENISSEGQAGYRPCNSWSNETASSPVLSKTHLNDLVWIYDREYTPGDNRDN